MTKHKRKTKKRLRAEEVRSTREEYTRYTRLVAEANYKVQLTTQFLHLKDFLTLKGCDLFEIENDTRIKFIDVLYRIFTYLPNPDKIEDSKLATYWTKEEIENMPVDKIGEDVSNYIKLLIDKEVIMYSYAK